MEDGCITFSLWKFPNEVENYIDFGFTSVALTSPSLLLLSSFCLAICLVSVVAPLCHHRYHLIHPPSNYLSIPPLNRGKSTLWVTDRGDIGYSIVDTLKGANIPSIQNAQKNLINPKVIHKKFYG